MINLDKTSPMESHHAFSGTTLGDTHSQLAPGNQQ